MTVSFEMGKGLCIDGEPLPFASKLRLDYGAGKSPVVIVELSIPIDEETLILNADALFPRLGKPENLTETFRVDIRKRGV